MKVELISGSYSAEFEGHFGDAPAALRKIAYKAEGKEEGHGRITPTAVDIAIALGVAIERRRPDRQNDFVWINEGWKLHIIR